MKALLTSAGFENKNIEKAFIELVSKEPQHMKILFIPTAAVTADAIMVLPKCLNDLLNAGIHKENIVIYDLHDQLSWTELSSYDAVYFCGGSCDYLLNRVNENGFNNLLEKYVNSGGVYVGVSAGSIIATNSMSHNLGYVNCKLAVHCEKGTKVGKINTSDCPYVLLTNKQALLLNDNSIEVIE